MVLLSWACQLAKTPVVYLTEQPKPSFRQTLAKAHLLDRTDLSILFWHDVMALPWPVAIPAAAMMGFAIQRGATCTVAAVSDIVHVRSTAHPRISRAVEAPEPEPDALSA